MKPVLFLDIDGVLNNPAYLARDTRLLTRVQLYRAMLDPEKVELLNVIFDAIEDLELVFSSEQRRFMPGHARGLVYLLWSQGFTRKFMPASGTPHTGSRVGDILAWLEQTEGDWLPIVLDDSTEVSELGERGFIVIQTDPSEGLTRELADKLVERVLARMNSGEGSR